MDLILTWVMAQLIPRLLNFVWSILCSPVYTIMSLCYNAFLALPHLNLLKIEEIKEIYSRVTVILIIVMAFYITFEVVKYVVQPDAITDKEKGAGNLAKRIVVVILLIAFVPNIFDLAYQLQSRILDSNVIGNVILGKEENKEDDTLLTTAGTNFAADVFSLFYGVNPDACPLDENGNPSNSNVVCKNAHDIVDTTLNLLRNYPLLVGRVTQLTSLIGTFIPVEVDTDDNGEPETVNVIEFSGLLALGVGVYITWTLLVYGVELAKRYFQLIFLQIISPIAIISYISPKKDGTFQKWVKQCITTYLDVFIRIALINFILLILGKLHTAFFTSGRTGSEIWGNFKLVGYNPITLVLLYVLLIIGLLNFAKKAPKMLSELLPSSNAASGSFGMSGKEAIASVKSIVGGTSRAIGGTYGAIIGAKTAITSKHLAGDANKNDRRWSAMKGAFAGAKAGFSKGGGIKKAGAAARGSVYKDEDIVSNNGSVIGHDLRGGYYAHQNKMYDRDIASLDGVKKGKSNVSNAVNETGVMKSAVSAKNSWDHENLGTSASREKAKKDIEKATKLYAVSSRDAYAQTTYKDAIKEAIDNVYDSAKSQVGIDFDAKKTSLESQINDAQANLEYINAKRKIEEIDRFVGPLTQEQIAERNAAIKVQTETEEKIKELNLSIDNLEQDRSVELSKLEQKRIIAFDEITQKVGQEESLVNSVRTALEAAQRDANFTYRDPNNNNAPSKDIVMIEIKDPADPTRTIMVDATDPAYLNVFAEKQGDIADRAVEVKDQIEQHDERRKAKANSNDAEKSGK